MTVGIFELALVVAIAAMLGVVAKFLRQPLVVAYLFTGIIIGLGGFLHGVDEETFKLFSDLGIMFLLFLVGMEINYSSLRLVGRASLFVGLGQVVLTFLVGFLLSFILGFDQLSSAYIALAITFSSTIVVVKMLSDKRDANSLYGKIAVGVLLTQDLIAVLFLVLLGGIETGSGASVLDVAFKLGINVALFSVILFLSRFLFPKIFSKLGSSRELLFLSSLGWVFILAVLVTKIGLSIEIAGFLAGVALANSAEHFQIASYVRPLRDFFILIFFVLLGSSFVFSDLAGVALPVIVLSVFVLFVSPFIIFAIMGALGYRKRTSFMTGLILAQISEFSLVIVALGVSLGHINDQVVAILTMVAVLTIMVSSYMTMNSERLYKRMTKFLSLFEKKSAKQEEDFAVIPTKPIILIGCHRTGRSILNNLDKDDVLGIDFDPEVINQLKYNGVAHVLGDVTDPEVQDNIRFGQARVVISTSPDVDDSLEILCYIKKRLQKNKRPKFIARAETREEGEELYKAGADYVLLPLFSIGDYLGRTIASKTGLRGLGKLKARDLAMIRKV